MRIVAHSAAVLFVALFAALVEAPSAYAQTPNGTFSVLRFAPAPGPGNYFQTDGARVHGELEGSAGLLLDYAHNPLTLYPATCDADGMNCELDPNNPRTELVRYTATGHLWGAIAISRRLQIALQVPFAYSEGDRFQPAMGVLVAGGNAFVVGDPRLHLKVNLLDDAGGFRLGVVVYGSVPLAVQIAPRRFLGDETPTFGGHLIAEMASGGFRIAANLGGIWRDGQTLFSTQATSQFTYNIGIGYDITPLVGIFGEVAGATAFSSAVDENMLEGRLGGRFRVDDVTFELGGGAGIIAGVGVPVFRVLGGFSWAPMSADADGDHILDDLDACPGDPEDLDDFNDADGCPEEDNDQDGINDDGDQCPDAAEDIDQIDDEDGCPDMDTDGDGVQDGYDSCPNEMEDMDGDRDEDGCPDLDRDRDNINDAADACPDEPEDTDGYGDEDGCPEVDFDGDNLPDDGDGCPDQPEDLDGFEDEDGCPEEGGPPVEEPAAGGRTRTRGR